VCVEHTDVVDVDVVGGSVVDGPGLGGPGLGLGGLGGLGLGLGGLGPGPGGLGGLGGLEQISLLTLTHAPFETSHPITGSQVFGKEIDRYEHSLQ